MSFEIPLTKPFINEEVKQKVCEVLESGMLTEGTVTQDLEKQFEKYLGCSHAIAVTSCTTGLEVALRALGIGAGDEVIIPDYTYPATAHVVDIVGAKTILVDIDPTTLNIDYTALEKAITLKTKAVIPVSLFGNPLNYDRLNEIRLAAKKKFDQIPSNPTFPNQPAFYIIEDAACALGSDFNRRKVGGPQNETLPDIAVFSLHPRKFITTGEGGILTTENLEWAKWIRSYTHFGTDNSESRLTTEFIRTGTNYKLSNILAAVGSVQMQQIDKLLSHRRKQVEHYRILISALKLGKIILPQTTQGGTHSYQSFCVLIENRNQVMQKMRSEKIEVQIGTYSLHKHRAFIENTNCHFHNSIHQGLNKGFPNFPGSEYAFDHCLTLPLFHSLTEGEQERVIRSLQKFI